MDALESEILHLPTIALFKRYVDDIFILTTGEEEANSLLRRFNDLDPNISFEMELPERVELSLLDFAVRYISNRTGPACPSFSFSFYKKPEKKDIFINARRAMSTSLKMNCIQNETNRIRTRCSNTENQTTSIKSFENTLRKNDYLKGTIEQLQD